MSAGAGFPVHAPRRTVLVQIPIAEAQHLLDVLPVGVFPATIIALCALIKSGALPAPQSDAISALAILESPKLT